MAVLTDRLPYHHCHAANIWGNRCRMMEHRELREFMRRSEDGDEPRQGEAVL